MNHWREVRLSTVVMAHPSRRGRALRLQEQFPELEIRIVLDPEPDGPPATLRTAIAAWGAVAPDATHHLVLQDDVKLCDGFSEAVVQALRVAPEGGVALFANWVMTTAQAIRLAALTGASWTSVVDDWLPTQAFVIPADLAREFAVYATTLPTWKPDNRALHTFLAGRGLTSHVSIPNLVEHSDAPSLLLNDLLYGVRDATVFPSGRDMRDHPLNSTIFTPSAIAFAGPSDYEYLVHYQPLGSTDLSTTTPAHELLLRYGMSDADLAGMFRRDRSRHPEVADAPQFAECLQFQLWLTMFTLGIIGCDCLDPADPAALDKAFSRPWARAAMATFPAAELGRLVRAEALRGTAKLFESFCLTAFETGFTAAAQWPGLKALWRPDEHEIKPRWAYDEPTAA